MLFWIVVILLVVGIVCCIIGSQSWKLDTLEFTGVIISIISVVVLICMIVVIIINYSVADPMVASNMERYQALTYKLESGVCRDELGLLSKSVIDEIQEWNEEVVSYKVKQDNFWVGIFYPNVFDQFETIDYNNYNTGK